MTTKSARRPIHPALLPGGDVGGFWPVARTAAPSWLQPLFDGRSPFQETVAAFDAPDLFAPPTIVAGAEHRFRIAQQFADIDVAPADIILEPAPRGGLAAAAAAVARLAERSLDDLVLLSSADQAVRACDRGAFRRAVAAAAADAEAGAVVRFAAPRRDWLHGRAGMGANLVDAGWVLTTVGALARAIEAAAPGVRAAAESAVARAATDLDFLRLDAEAYDQAPTSPFEHLLEAAATATHTHALDFSPLTAGGWSGLRAAQSDRQDQDGNLVDGDAMLFGARNCYVNAGGRLATLAGVSDLAVVVTDDAVLVADMADPSAAMTAGERVRAAGREEARAHPMEHRPWGDFKRLTAGPRYQVKRITVKPGGATSLQKHHHRAEHWVVVAGTAEITVDGATRLLQENESIYLPLGSAHRLANPGKIALELIEVQSGAYLGEDDIVRLDDPYRRDAP